MQMIYSQLKTKKQKPTTGGSTFYIAPRRDPKSQDLTVKTLSILYANKKINLKKKKQQRNGTSKKSIDLLEREIQSLTVEEEVLSAGYMKQNKYNLKMDGGYYATFSSGNFF
ncbi:hypothetical protein MANES_15G131501v8 [Manihot esculenta]|uniref:Uncharacterized protein n=1 Tax=Manihot esculenta TaxID=3983 RepID=A0ACB7GBB9_MANES|nr:hypothetical protein MANES_15G131501v8 [Manihot esculenta]